HTGREGHWIPETTWDTLPKCLAFYFNNSYFLMGVALLLYAVLLGCYALGGKRRSREAAPGAHRFGACPPGAVLALWLVVPHVLAVAVSLTVARVVTERNLIVALPPALLLLARALATLPLPATFRNAIATTIVVFTAGQLLFDIDYFSKPQKEQYREAAQYILERDAEYPDAPIIAYAWREYDLNHYFKRLGSARRVAFRAGKEEEIPETRKRIAAAQTDYFWYVAAHRTPDKPFLRFLFSEYSVCKYRELVGVYIWLLETLPPAG
ncbi:MAG TPA: hypothetical protein HPP83_08965, partial [Candidatus Hydrogenedentes bacterium]|nr:hypothetical protein [Candidatus Hydrogenedentota bacterium]